MAQAQKPVEKKLDWRPTTIPPVLGNGQVMQCAYRNCINNGVDEFRRPKGVHVGHVAPSAIASFAAAHGWVECEGAVFCSRTCMEIEFRLKGVSSDNRHALAAGGTIDVTRVSVRDFTAHDNTLAREIVCDHAECPTRIRVSATATPEQLMSVAKANGFRQAIHGTFCSGDCCKRARADILAGRVKPKQMSMVAAPAVVQPAASAPVMAAGGVPATSDIPLAPPPPAPPELLVVQSDKPAPDKPSIVDMASGEPTETTRTMPEPRRHRGPRRG
jgi:hypothetical protein